MKPPIIAAMPSSQTGWRASRTRSRASKPAVSVALAPLRWHSEAVAVHTLAAMASRIALSISLPLRLASPAGWRLYGCPGPAGLHCVVSCCDDSGAAASSACTAVSALALRAHGSVRLRLRLPRPGPQGLDERTGDGLDAAFFRD